MLRQLFFLLHGNKEGGFIDNTELLKYAIKNGIIDLEHVQEEIEMKEREEKLNNHTNKIWQGENGLWYTYLPDEKKGRVLRKRKTEEEIKTLVIEYYKKREKQEKVTFKFAYDRWVKAHSVTFKSENTLIKYKSDYKRFFEGRKIEFWNIKTFNEENVTEYIISLCKELELHQKACKTLCSYMRNTFKSAKIHKDISENPFDNLETKQFYPYCKKVKKTAKERTISSKEFDLLYERFYKDYEEKPNYIPTYAVEFASITGFRVGEISALRWKDIKFTGSCQAIHVCKSEKYNRKTKQYWIDTTKNEKERDVPLTDELVNLLYRVKKVEERYGYLCEYVFANETGRIHAPVISSCAKNKCKQIGIPVKSIHSYRRTFSSKLKCNGISSTVVASILGHTEEVNERYYTYDVTEMSEKLAWVQAVTKEIVNRKSPANVAGNQKVIKSNQNTHSPETLQSA